MVARDAGSRTGGNQTADKNASAETNCETGDDSVPRGKPWKTALSGRSAFYSTHVHTDRNSPPSRCGRCLDAKDDARNGRLFSRDCLPPRVVGVVNRLEISPVTSFTTSLQEVGAKNHPEVVQSWRYTHAERRFFFSRQ